MNSDTEMEIVTGTGSGTKVLLRVERDSRGVFQVYAYLTVPGGAGEERLLCGGWRVRRSGQGLEAGINTPGLLIQVPKADWDKIVAVREDLRDRDNLMDVHLVRVSSKGDVLTVAGYTLSARVDSRTWERIAHCMVEVDSSVNNELFEGDHFKGWIIRAGMESEVEGILAEVRRGISPECG